MRTIFGIGVPAKIKSNGVIYVDNLNGNRYIQTQIPRGNSWQLLNDSPTNSSSGQENAVSVFTQLFTFSETDLAQIDPNINSAGVLFPDTLGSDSLPGYNSSIGGLTHIINIQSQLTGDPITTNGDTLYTGYVDGGFFTGIYGRWMSETSRCGLLNQIINWQPEEGYVNVRLSQPFNNSALSLFLNTGFATPFNFTGNNTLKIWITFAFVPYS